MMTAKLSRIINKENEGKDLTFSKGVIKCNSFKAMSGMVELYGIYKQGYSWRVVSTSNNYWTIKTLPIGIQNQLFDMINSHYSNESFSQDYVYTID